MQSDFRIMRERNSVSALRLNLSTSNALPIKNENFSRQTPKQDLNQTIEY